MSRIGNKVIEVPSGVTVSLDGASVEVKGPKGTLAGAVPAPITAELDGDTLKLLRPDEKKETRALHGLARALVANMVGGVTEGFTRELEIVGVGYRADVKGKTLNLSLGFSHPVEMPIPEGLSVEVEENTKLKVSGADKGMVGQFSAEIRKLRPPEPYKGKGVRYSDERVRRKVGKAGVS